jgi:hypothetical protein
VDRCSLTQRVGVATLAAGTLRAGNPPAWHWVDRTTCLKLDRPVTCLRQSPELPIDLVGVGVGCKRASAQQDQELHASLCAYVEFATSSVSKGPHVSLLGVAMQARWEVVLSTVDGRAGDISGRFRGQWHILTSHLGFGVSFRLLVRIGRIRLSIS